MRSVETKLALAAAFALLAATPASADDGRRHVMTPMQKIDMVRDLPDGPPFERDGQSLDLGYIYPIHTVNGASVASAGTSSDSGFVLYHDDMYLRVDAAVMSDLRYVLGEDPTQGYTPPAPVSASRAAAADPWGANGKADTPSGQPFASTSTRNSSARRSGGVFGAIFIIFLALFIRVRIFRDLVIGGVLAAIAAIARRGGGGSDFAPGAGAPNDSLGAQAAAQRARLDALSGAPAAADNPRGFGRKVA